VAEFEVHTAADVLQFEHGAAPGGASDGDLHGVGAELGMAGQESFAAAEQDGGVDVVKSLNFQDGGGREIVEKNAAFDFGLDDDVVDFVG
jgi:hypothetical protein